MPRHIPVLVALTVIGVAAADAGRRLRPDASRSVPAAPPVGHARVDACRASIKGVVRDDAGQAVRGVSIVAMGTIIAAVRSDDAGSSRLALPPGEYHPARACEGYRV